MTFFFSSDEATLYRLCNSTQSQFSGLLNTSFKKLVESLIEFEREKLAEIHIHQLPNLIIRSLNNVK